MRAPNFSGAVKSIGVPFTGLISPVGIRVLSIGVKLSALTVITWPSTSPLPCPARLKNVCVVKLSRHIATHCAHDVHGLANLEFMRRHRISHTRPGPRALALT